MFLALAEALQALDAFSGAHSLRVASLASTVGERLVQALAPARATLACALYHHERWDGGGYPLGRSGGKIPPEARLLAVVDAFDAMTFGRPFRRPLTVDAALAELDRCSGTQFEPAVVRAFFDACDAGDVDLRRRAS